VKKGFQMVEQINRTYQLCDFFLVLGWLLVLKHVLS